MRERGVLAVGARVSGGWLNGRALRIYGEGPRFDSDPGNGDSPMLIGRPGLQQPEILQRSGFESQSALFWGVSAGGGRVGQSLAGGSQPQMGCGYRVCTYVHTL